MNGTRGRYERLNERGNQREGKKGKLQDRVRMCREWVTEKVEIARPGEEGQRVGVRKRGN